MGKWLTQSDTLVLRHSASAVAVSNELRESCTDCATGETNE